jgi:hypothetical protein
MYLAMAERRAQAIAYMYESARLATRAGGTAALGRALLNLSDVLAPADPVASAEAARTAAGHLRRTGERKGLAFAVVNLACSLTDLGDWDAAEAELTQAMDSDGLMDIEYLACHRGWLVALRGDAGTSETMLAALRDLRASEDPQEKSLISIVAAFTAAARREPRDTLRHARDTLAHAGVLGISSQYLRWAWPLAARAADELDDIAAARELLALLDSYPPGHLAPMLRAERDLTRARLTAGDGQAVTASFTAAIVGLRELGTPYHLAHGLLDQARCLQRQGDSQAAELAIEEAREIGRRLRCEPLLDRAGTLTPKGPAFEPAT